MFMVFTREKMVIFMGELLVSGRVSVFFFKKIKYLAPAWNEQNSLSQCDELFFVTVPMLVPCKREAAAQIHQKLQVPKMEESWTV